MEDSTALQIAMRVHLRHRYWLTNCAPLGPVAINNIQLRMARRNSRDVITDEEVTELLSPEYGFHRAVTPDGEIMGWHIPELAEQRGVMLDARTLERTRKAEFRVKKPASGSAAVPDGPLSNSEPANSGSDDF